MRLMREALARTGRTILGAFVIALMLAMIVIGFVIALLLLPVVLIVQAIRGGGPRGVTQEGRGVRRNVRIRPPVTGE